MLINTYDIDGVIYMGEDLDGLRPNVNDVIITGRSIEEQKETEIVLNKKGIKNNVFYNQLPFDEKSRESSGVHKGNTIKMLQEDGFEIGIHFEDDPIQAEEIKKICPEVNVVLIVHDLVTKENVKREYDDEGELVSETLFIEEEVLIV